MLLIVITHAIIESNCWGAEYYYILFFRTFTRIAVPIFFIISGYLLFSNYEYKKIIKRTKTVFLPFILWSLISLSIFLILESIPSTSSFVNTKISLNIESILYYIFVKPINGALWFLRDLYILILFSPVIKIINRNKYILKSIIVLLFLIWIIDIKYTFLIESSLFFLIGDAIAVQKSNVFIIDKTRRFNNKTLLIIFGLACIVLPFIPIIYSIDPIRISKISIILGLFALYKNIDIFYNENKLNFYLDKFKKYSFFVYASHLIIIQGIKKLLNFIFPHDNLFFVISEYLMTICITIAICCLIQNFLYEISPKLLKILTGNRCQ